MSGFRTDAQIRAQIASDRLAPARAAFASLIQRDAWMLNRYGTGERCPIVAVPGAGYGCLVHEGGTAEATDVRCSEAVRLADVAALSGLLDQAVAAEAVELAATGRLPHCTPTFGPHSLLCDRDGAYCSEASTHAGPCKPHGDRASAAARDLDAQMRREGRDPGSLRR